MSTTQISESKSATSLVVSKQLLELGAKVAQQLRVNGIEQRDKELVVKNLLNRINNGQRPEWQKLMRQVDETAGKNNTQRRVIVEQIVDHLLQQ